MKMKYKNQLEHNPALNRDIKAISNGYFDMSTKGETITIKGITEEDIRDLRQMILEEIKRQKEEDL